MREGPSDRTGGGLTCRGARVRWAAWHPHDGTGDRRAHGAAVSLGLWRTTVLYRLKQLNGPRQPYRNGQCCGERAAGMVREQEICLEREVAHV